MLSWVTWVSLIILACKIIPVHELCKHKCLRPWEKIKTRKNIKGRIIVFHVLTVFSVPIAFQKCWFLQTATRNADLCKPEVMLSPHERKGTFWPILSYLMGRLFWAAKQSSSSGSCLCLMCACGFPPCPSRIRGALPEVWFEKCKPDLGWDLCPHSESLYKLEWSHFIFVSLLRGPTDFLGWVSWKRKREMLPEIFSFFVSFCCFYLLHYFLVFSRS